MRRARPPSLRNKLDLTDRPQVRLVRKRLGMSDSELADIVGRIGNSIAAISKEVALKQARAMPQPAEVPPAAVIAAATEQTTDELSAATPS
jgi:hypothetical protein